MNYIFFAVKNSYLIHVLLKNYNFCWKRFLRYCTHFCTIALKHTQVDLKIETKRYDEIFSRN